MSAHPTPVTRRAPGKLFVAGEYAVTEAGIPALLMAVDRHVTVTVAGPSGAQVTISSDLTAGPARLRWDAGRLVLADSGRPVGPSLAHVVATVETVAKLLNEQGFVLPEITVSVSSRLHNEGVKLGLGSSGAVGVATVDAVTAYCGLAPSAEQRYRLALLAAAAIGAAGSGGDLAAATWGGWIEYRAPDRPAVLALARRRGVTAALEEAWPGFAVTRLPAPADLVLETGWTGAPASTTLMLSDLHRSAWRGTPSHRRFVAATTECVRSCVSALTRGDGHALLEPIRRARAELARLDTETGIGIFTPSLTALCDIAQELGGAAKPSGAGGGDCGIALLDDPNLVQELRHRWAAAGVQPVHLHAASERGSRDRLPGPSTPPSDAP
ncbi:phosphomevalonate kinase [Kitasatospora sp. NPDC089913]|uniref:phosphomevalonate kinase n=1 Tax=Kitasatospora sp. NPDC089913 TaxID=3364080 RepID=UPI00382668EC